MLGGDTWVSLSPNFLLHFDLPSGQDVFPPTTSTGATSTSASPPPYHSTRRQQSNKQPFTSTENYQQTQANDQPSVATVDFVPRTSKSFFLCVPRNYLVLPPLNQDRPRSLGGAGQLRQCQAPHHQQPHRVEGRGELLPALVEQPARFCVMMTLTCALRPTTADPEVDSYPAVNLMSGGKRSQPVCFVSSVPPTAAPVLRASSPISSSFYGCLFVIIHDAFSDGISGNWLIP